MVIGSTLKDVLTVTPPSQDKTKDSSSTESGEFNYLQEHNYDFQVSLNHH